MTEPTEATDPYVTPTEAGVQLLAGAPWKRIAVIGDSISAGVREVVPGYQDLSWVDRISAVLRRIHPDFDEIRLARRDVTLAEIRRAQLPPALDFAPDLVFLSGGGNDFIRPGFDPVVARAELTEIVSGVRGSGADILTIGMLDISRAGVVSERFAGPIGEATRILTRITREVSQEHGAIFVSFTDHPLCADPGLYCGDKLHLNCRGQAFEATEKMCALAAHLAARSQVS
ncbi:SGNH/GDSL hydrolase family protein [Pseudofrankia sp. BMG5.37]|uniref:SGNH/GDSL hydrolase family protein n=1 Tax=Pseudofrankia sp. BMG5.37 TaxID=3050035 RepID=UPI00289452C6|nr:SGNH/GDSL hydrolase family protein [Pseudofrankia sp. BMG5.37]MDT3438103.1 SGNH/GDSL hydrolase family protein [Pseudofrankia sp. BMG5.37]